MISGIKDKLQAVAHEVFSLGDAYLYAGIDRHCDQDLLVSSVPDKSECIMMLLVRRGKLDVEVNDSSVVIDTPSVVMVPFGATFSIIGDGDVDLSLLAFSGKFIQSININISAIKLPSFVDRLQPAQQLSGAEVEIIDHFFEIIRINAKAKVNEQIERNIGASVMAAMFYQLVQFLYKRIDSTSFDKGKRTSRNGYVHDFMKLVQVHYLRERGVRFYADQLCISPKYLSLLVKETTGKSAARWIDDFVLMEAKNLLRFSGKNVQQVAYALNFTNQSSFGKFFKHLTGQSPTEYQKN